MGTGNRFHPLSPKNIWLIYQQFCLFLAVGSGGLMWGRDQWGGDAEVLHTEHQGGEQGPQIISKFHASWIKISSNQKRKRENKKNCASTYHSGNLLSCFLKGVESFCAKNWICETVWHSSNKHSFALGRTRQNVLSDYQKGGYKELVLGHAPVHVSKQKDERCRDFRTSEANNHMVREAGKTLVNRGNKKTFLLQFWRQIHGVMPGKEGMFS